MPLEQSAGVIITRGAIGPPGPGPTNAQVDQSVADYLATYTASRPVSLAAILPADTVTDATAALNAALAGTGTVFEWPAGAVRTVAGTVTIPAGKTLTGPGGGRIKYTGTGQAVMVHGHLSGVDVEASGTGLSSIAVWLMPGSDGARVESLRIYGSPGAGVVIGGSPDGPMAGTATNPVVAGVTVGDASQYAFRVDQSEGATLDGCTGLGAALDIIKARYSAERLTVKGGSFSGARAGDGIDTFQGGRWVHIIGVDLHDNSQSGVVVKTDGDPAATLAANMALGMPEQPQVIGCRIWNNGGVGLGMYRSDGTDSEAGPGVIPMLFGGLIDSCQIWDNAAEGIYLMGRGLTVANVQAWGNLTSTSSSSGQVNVDANARGVRLVGVTTYGASTVNGNQSGFRFAGQQIYASQCNAYGVRRADLIQAVDDAALYAVAAASRSQRFGFYVLAGADVHIHQSVARFSRLAGVSAAAGATVTYDDCRIEDAAGALIAGTAGKTYSYGQQVGWRHELVAGSPVFTKGLTLSDAGGSTYVIVGDNGATGAHYVVLSAKTQIQVPGVDLAVTGAGKVLAAGGLGTGGAAAATSMGAQVYKVPIYNASGALLGYIPVHSS